MTGGVGLQSRFWNRLRWIVIIVIGIVIVLPLLYIVLISLTPDSQVGDGSIFPTRIAWYNYVNMWQTINLASELFNSLLISAATGFFSTIVSLGASYVIARFRFRGRKVFLYSLISMQTIPGVMMLLPLFVVIAVIQQSLNVQLIGQYYTIILTYMTFALPFGCWLLLSYFGSIPVELEEAARIDGATQLQVLTHVIVPLILPGMVVAFVFSFLLAWNDVLFASVLTSQATRTIGVGLQAFLDSGDGGGVYWGQLMAASLTSGIPIVIIFLILQRYILGGLSSGAVKG